MEFENFPKFKDVESSIIKLKKNGFPDFEENIDVAKFVEGISKILTNEFGILPNLLKKFRHQELALKFFRARDIETISNINLIREHSYPPINSTGMGRCNFPKFPVFYCSDNPMTALIEVAKDINFLDKKYCISKWELLSPNEELIFQSFLQTKLPKQNQYISVRDNLNKNINKPFQKSLNKNLDKEREKGLLEYLEFLDTNFINDGSYSLSASLAYRALYSDHNFSTDILMYPSVQTQSKGVNMALNPNFVENNLKLSRLYVVETPDYDKDKNIFQITFIKYAEVEKNQIMWKEIKQNDKDFYQLMKEDFGNILNMKKANKQNN